MADSPEPSVTAALVRWSYPRNQAHGGHAHRYPMPDVQQAGEQSDLVEASRGFQGALEGPGGGGRVESAGGLFEGIGFGDFAVLAGNDGA